MKTVKTGSTTLKTAGTAEKMAGWGNAGNTKGTSLPNGGCARGAKKSGKRRKGY